MPRVDSLTQDRVRALLHYDADTGAFVWRPRCTGNATKDKWFNANWAGKNPLRWNPNGNALFLRIDGKLYPAHRVAWLYAYGAMPKSIGHRDGNTRNNRLANLYEVRKTGSRPLTQSLLHELLHYDAATGIFTWRPRDSTDRFTKTWNARYAYQQAANPMLNGYHSITIDDSTHYAHHLAWIYVFGDLPSLEIDHINGIRTDNRISNLRVVTRAVNAQNAKCPPSNRSGVIGVSWNKRLGKWQARMRRPQAKSHHIMVSHSFREACLARWREELRRGAAPRHWRSQTVDIGILWMPNMTPEGLRNWMADS